MQVEQLKQVIDGLTQAARESISAPFNIDISQEFVEDDIWSRIYMLLRPSIQYKQGAKHVVEFDKLESETKTKITQLLDELIKIPEDEFSEMLKDPIKKYILIYFCFLDAIHHRNMDDEKIQAKKNQIIDNPIIRAAIEFLSEKDKDNEITANFKKIRELTFNDSRVASALLIGRVNQVSGLLDQLPFFLADAVRTIFTVEIIIKIIQLNSKQLRFDLLSVTMPLMRQNVPQLVNLGHEVVLFYQIAALANRQSTTHSIFPKHNNILHRQFMNMTLLTHRAMVPLQNNDDLSTGSMLFIAKLTYILLRKYDDIQHCYLDERSFWLNCCQLFFYEQENAGTQRKYLSEYGILILAGLLRSSELSTAKLFAAFLLKIQRESSVLNSAELSVVNMVYSFLTPFDFEKDFKEFTLLKLSCFVSVNPNETYENYIYRLLLTNIFSAATHFISTEKINIAINLIEKSALKQADKDSKHSNFSNQLNMLASFMRFPFETDLTADKKKKQSNQRKKNEVPVVGKLKAFFKIFSQTLQDDFKITFFEYIRLAENQKLIDSNCSFDDRRVLAMYYKSLEPIQSALNLSKEKTSELGNLFFNQPDVAINDSSFQGKKGKNKKKKASSKNGPSPNSKNKASKKGARKSNRNKKTSTNITSIKRVAEPQPVAASSSSQCFFSVSAVGKQVLASPQPSSPQPNAEGFYPLGEESARDRLPKELLGLNSLIKELTGNFLIVVGGAVESFYLNEKDVKDYDCLVCIEPLKDLKDLKDALHSNGYTNATIHGKHQVLQLEVNKIEIEICTLEKGDGVYGHLRTDAYKRDFKSSAMYLLMSEADKFEIFDPTGGLKCLDDKSIDIINNDDLFKEDPIRLFRLVKLMLKRPDFRLAQPLTDKLNSIDFTGLWKDYLVDANAKKLHPARIKTALSRLLHRFEAENVVAAFDHIGSLSGLMGIESHQLEAYKYLHENFKHLEEDKLFLIAATLFFHAHQQDSKIQVSDWPLMPVVSSNRDMVFFVRDIRDFYIENKPIPKGVSIDAKTVIDHLDDFQSAPASSYGATGFK